VSREGREEGEGRNATKILPEANTTPLVITKAQRKDQPYARDRVRETERKWISGSRSAGLRLPLEDEKHSKKKRTQTNPDGEGNNSH